MARVVINRDAPRRRAEEAPVDDDDEQLRLFASIVDDGAPLTNAPPRALRRATEAIAGLSRGGGEGTSDATAATRGNTTSGCRTNQPALLRVRGR